MSGPRHEERSMRTWILSFLVFSVALPAVADEYSRLYDAQGRFAGSYRETPSGVIRMYGANNEYVGSVFPSGNGGYRLYNSRGEFKGSVHSKDRALSGGADRQR
jgi:hypothetical protein